MKYNFKFKPNNHQRKPRNFMKEIGYEPYRAIQPNGYSDLEIDWMSPELLIRRISAPTDLARRNIELKDFKKMIDKNFDDPEELKKLISDVKSTSIKMQLIFRKLQDVKSMISRRNFLAGSMTVTLLGSPLFSAIAEQKKKRNLVIISLRGGMDGLSAIPPIDNALEKYRPDILVRKILPLTSDFALHPSLKKFLSVLERWESFNCSRHEYTL